jgi:hypothetical protein
MQEPYPSLWLEYLTDQCTEQQKLNFETEILPQTQVKSELLELQNLLQDLHDALIFND